MAFCPGCGKQLTEKANFCFYCGRDVSQLWENGPEVVRPVQPETKQENVQRVVNSMAHHAQTLENNRAAGQPSGGKQAEAPEQGTAGMGSNRNAQMFYGGSDDAVRLESWNRSQPQKAVLEFTGEQVLHKSVICTYIKSKLPAFQVNGDLLVTTKKLEFEAKMGLGKNVTFYWRDIASVREDTYMMVSPAILVTTRDGKSHKFAYMAIHKQQMAETLNWIRKAQQG